MTVLTESDMAEIEGVARRNWWLFLIGGIAWTVISFMILTVDPTTPAMIGYLTGFVILLAGINEFLAAGLVDDWKWVHVVLGVLFVVGGIMALLEPFQTFGLLAVLIGWFLLFKGVTDLVMAIVGRDVIPLWGLLLAAGIAELIIGVWAIGYPGRSAWLLILWVGIAALSRGITEIVLAFRLRSGTPA